MLRRILAADSSSTVRQALRRELGAYFDVVLAGNYSEAIHEFSSSHQFVAVLANVDFGGGPTGSDLLAEVQRRSPNCARILLVEGLVRSSTSSLMIASAAQHFATKPWKQGDLVALLQKALGSAPQPTPSAPLPENESSVSVKVYLSSWAWNGYQPLWTRGADTNGATVTYSGKIQPPPGSPVLMRFGNHSLMARVVPLAQMPGGSQSAPGFRFNFLKPLASGWWRSLPPPELDEEAQNPTSSVETISPVPGPSATPAQIEAARRFFSLGMDFFQAKRFLPARQKFEQAHKVVPDPQYLAMQFVCNAHQYLSAGMPERARADFLRATQTDPGCALAKEGIARLGPQ